MALLCELCQTANRDGAKFCKGCGRKIAQSWADADGATLALGHEAFALPGSSARIGAAGAAGESSGNDARPGATHSRSGWRLIFPAAGLILLVAAVAWFAMAHRSEEVSEGPKVPLVPASAATQVSAQPSPAAAPALAAPPVETASPAPANGNAAGPADSSQIDHVVDVAPEPKPKPARKPAARKPAPAPAPVEASPPPVPAVAPPAPPTPQEACAGLNFVAKARCLAAQCARAEQKAHPQCQAVREQQRLEEEKRNPQMAS